MSGKFVDIEFEDSVTIEEAEIRVRLLCERIGIDPEKVKIRRIVVSEGGITYWRDKDQNKESE